MMTWLERYILLERVFADLEDSNEFKTSELMENILNEIYYKLNEEDLEYIWNRGKFEKTEDLDHVELPKNQLWRPVHNATI
jgi:hypothetical protein